MTLERDKEDQSKYYVCHLKPPVLKWGNYDINVVDWAKHSKVFSSTKWRLGENVVLQLMERLNPSISFDIFMDNYFTFF